MVWPRGGFGRARSAVDSRSAAIMLKIVRSPPQTHIRRDLEGIFRRTEELSGRKHRQFILLTAVREEAETPPLLVAEVPQPTQVHRRSEHSLHVLIACLRPVCRRPVRTGRHRFRVCIDVAELRSKPDIQACITSSVMLVGIAAQACFRALPNQFGNGFPTTIRVESPRALPRPSQMIQSPGMV